MLGEPGLRDALLHPRQPGLDDEVVELLAVEPGEVGDPHEHRRIVVEVRRREVDAAVVGEADLLLVEVADAEHQHVVEALAGVADRRRRDAGCGGTRRPCRAPCRRGGRRPTSRRRSREAPARARPGRPSSPWRESACSHKTHSRDNEVAVIMSGVQLTFPRRRRVVPLALAGVLLGAMSAVAAAAALARSSVGAQPRTATWPSATRSRRAKGSRRSSRAGLRATAPPGRTRPGCGRPATRSRCTRSPRAAPAAGAGGGANLYGSDIERALGEPRHVGDVRVLGRDDGERPAAEPRRRAAGCRRPLRRQDADRQRLPRPRQPGHAHARRQRRRLRRRPHHLRPRQLQHARVRAQQGGDHRPG